MSGAWARLPGSVRWRAWAGDGLEHLALTPIADGGVAAEGVVIGARGGVPYGFGYRLVVDGAWRVRALRAAVAGGARLELRADGAGNWTTVEGEALPALAGCIDVDLAATPFTNTLPIRRLGLAAGESRELRVAYVPLPSLAPEPAAQRYTCLEAGRRYLYEGLFRGFRGALAVDEAGLVRDYPETFRRIL